MFMTPKSLKAILWVVAALNGTLTLLTLAQWASRHNDSPKVTGSDKEYSYIGMDFPLQYPMVPLDNVVMSTHETIRYDLDLSDPIAETEWDLLLSNPKGFGRTRLGPDYRVFVIVFYHQMHCLRKIEAGLLNRSHPISTPHHVQHCINYLRQTFLCGADDALEHGDFMLKDYETDRLGNERVCQDWDRAYDVLDDNYNGWLQWRSKWN
ncbi:hypothetical protein C8J56DRAFT_1170445 [Mycena floridula]|nr:hypothetical protein C8J56DRAFT_1170445 [Mycena floridula]